MSLVIKDKSYLQFLKIIKEKIQTAQLRATKSANRELVSLYFQIGKEIAERKKKLGWGKSVVERLSKDLRGTFTATRGFSVQNLWYMHQFYTEYKDHPNLQQVAGEISWFTNVMIFSKIKDYASREYYLSATAEMGWSRNVLLNQIKAQAYERQVLFPRQHTFKKTLPKDLALEADQTMKDVYMLDFLGITKPVIEKEMERRMVEAIKDVLLELGYGFSFIGNQYKIRLDKKEYFIDLLFYHRKLQCLVAIELKSGHFQPEYAGKMNFYLNLLDNLVREKNENPSIGIILCADKDRVEVEYALNGINKPIGVAKYSLTQSLPEMLSGKLPDAKKLEEEILRELEK